MPDWTIAGTHDALRLNSCSRMLRCGNDRHTYACKASTTGASINKTIWATAESRVLAQPPTAVLTCYRNAAAAIQGSRPSFAS